MAGIMEHVRTADCFRNLPLPLKASSKRQTLRMKNRSGLDDVDHWGRRICCCANNDWEQRCHCSDQKRGDVVRKTVDFKVTPLKVNLNHKLVLLINAAHAPLAVAP